VREKIILISNYEICRILFIFLKISNHIIICQKMDFIKYWGKNAKMKIGEEKEWSLKISICWL